MNSRPASGEGMGTGNRGESAIERAPRWEFCHQNKGVVVTCISFSAFQNYYELFLFCSLTEILPKNSIVFSWL